MADWQAIKTEYITTDTSYRKLAEKYGVSTTQINRVGKEEGWVQLRQQFVDKTVANSIRKISNQRANQAARIDRAADRLIEKVERAIEELDIQLATHTTKEKVIEYNNAQRPDKPTREVIHETEEIVQIASIVDRAGLRQLTAALKDLKEVKGILSDLEKQEKQARIDNLRRQASADSADGDAVTVQLEGGVEEYAL